MADSELTKGLGAPAVLPEHPARASFEAKHPNGDEVPSMIRKAFFGLWCDGWDAARAEVRAGAVPVDPQQPIGWRYRDTTYDKNFADAHVNNDWSVAWRPEKPSIAWTNHVIEPLYAGAAPAGVPALTELIDAMEFWAIDHLDESQRFTLDDFVARLRLAMSKENGNG